MPAASAHPLTSQIIETEAQLRALIGEPAQLTGTKISNRLNSMPRLFVERSPFVCVATSDSAGHCELSPRRDPAGFVRILDNSTLLIPERPGNRLADSLRNVLANPHVGLLFIVPGVTDTFRVNGRATITTDTALLAPCAVEGAELYTYYVNMLRSILEKTATFFGNDDFFSCIHGLDDEDLFARALNLLSHGKYDVYQPAEMVDDNKWLFRQILDAFLGRYHFALPDIFGRPVAKATPPAAA